MWPVAPLSALNWPLVQRLPILVLLSALLMNGQSNIDLPDCLEALARTAATFARNAAGLTATETLDQRGRRGFIRVLRGEKNTLKKLDVQLPGDFRTHHVVSSYALLEIGEKNVLHEVRRITAMDGKQVSADVDFRQVLTGGLQSADDLTKRKLLEDLDRNQLEGAATDFSQLILLFQGGLQKDYDFALAGERRLGDEAAFAVKYQQIAGPEGLTVFNDRTAERERASGEIWFLRQDLLPVQITLDADKKLSKKYTIRTAATVVYMASPFGLVPASVIHRQLLHGGAFADRLMVENDFHYTNFSHVYRQIP